MPFQLFKHPSDCKTLYSLFYSILKHAFIETRSGRLLGSEGIPVIINGTIVTDRTQVPFAARLHRSGRLTMSCTASLLTTRRVLTAGHCVQPISNPYDIYVGDLSVSNTAEPQEQKVSGRAVVPPEYLNVYHVDFDIAIVILDTAVTLNSYVQTIALPPATYRLGSTKIPITSYGWGRDTLGNPCKSNPAVLSKFYRVI